MVVFRIFFILFVFTTFGHNLHRIKPACIEGTNMRSCFYTLSGILFTLNYSVRDIFCLYVQCVYFLTVLLQDTRKEKVQSFLRLRHKAHQKARSKYLAILTWQT